MIPMALEKTQAKEIIGIIKAAGERGITKRDISRAVKDRGCDIENWIITLLEAGVIEKSGKQNGADLYRFIK